MFGFGRNKNNQSQMEEDRLQIVAKWNEIMVSAIQAKRTGNYTGALALYDQLYSKYSTYAENSPRFWIARAKVLTLLGRIPEARDAYTRGIKYLILHENEVMTSNDQMLIGNCMGAIEHIGYCMGGSWSDASEYLAGLAGRPSSPDPKQSAKRMYKGLQTLKGSGLWCATFDLVYENVRSMGISS